MASLYTYHYSDVVMSTTASKITGVSIDYSTVYWGADQIKYQCSVSLAFMGELPVQRASNAENVFIWWRHYESSQLRD